MHFSTFLNVLVPVASLLASSVDVEARSSGHGGRRSHHAAAGQRLSKPVSDRDLYLAAAHQARGENPSPKPLRKRGSTGCSTGSTGSTNSSSTYPVASPTFASVVSSAAASVASSAAASVASSAAASSVVNVGAHVETASPVASSSSSAPSASATSQYNSPWKLQNEASGNTFFDQWNVWSYPDPTHGTVNYVDQGTAWDEKLIYVKENGNAVMTVDNTQQVSGGRNSVRLHHKTIFNGGLLIFDAVHMPTGCGVWPAFWSNGPDWPNGGEIDILEGVNLFTENQVSVHTSDGCTIPEDYGATGTLTGGDFDQHNCAAYATGNQGCGMRSSSANNYGAPFNTNGGGVYAMKWDDSGISVYFFPRNAIPDDITAGEPMPSTWGLPMGNYPSTSCNPYTFFKNHFAILNTTFCGDWAGSVWNQSGWAGQSTSCAASTGYSTCEDYVLNQGSKMDQAFWEVKYMKMYQPK